MSKSRRQFLVREPLGLAGAALTSCRKAAPKTTEAPAGTPPDFGTAPPVGPEVSPPTFTEAEKLVQAELTNAERAQAAGKLAQLDGATLRAAHRAATGEDRACGAAVVALGGSIARRESRPAARIEKRHVAGGRRGPVPVISRAQEGTEPREKCQKKPDHGPSLHDAGDRKAGSASY